MWWHLVERCCSCIACVFRFLFVNTLYIIMMMGHIYNRAYRTHCASDFCVIVVDVSSWYFFFFFLLSSLLLLFIRSFVCASNVFRFRCAQIERKTQTRASGKERREQKSKQKKWALRINNLFVIHIRRCRFQSFNHVDCASAWVAVWIYKPDNCALNASASISPIYFHVSSKLWACTSRCMCSTGWIMLHVSHI